MDEINILITDDHPIVRAGIRGILETQPEFEVVAEAENGREAVDKARQLKPDVILMLGVRSFLVKKEWIFTLSSSKSCILNKYICEKNLYFANNSITFDYSADLPNKFH